MTKSWRPQSTWPETLYGGGYTIYVPERAEMKNMMLLNAILLRKYCDAMPMIRFVLLSAMTLCEKLIVERINGADTVTRAIVEI